MTALKTTRLFTRGIATLLALVGLSGCFKPSGGTQPHSGQTLYGGCVSCHGALGQGMPSIAAPAIAGLPKWYVEAQLKKFRVGHRGYHPDDVEGLKMRPMSRQLDNELEIATVSEYVEKLAKVNPSPTLTGGDAEAGKALYNTCLACHGPDGRGNQALNAPPLVGANDWYLLNQLKKFKGGLRGTAPGDTSGATMYPMSMTLADEQAMKNVLAHIATLPK